MNRTLLSGVLVLALSASANAQPSQGSVVISGAWARATPPGSSSAAVYLTIMDRGEADTLTSASTPVAAKAQLHEGTVMGGMMRMQPLDSLAIDKGRSVTLAPAGSHLMLSGLQQPLKAGDIFPLTLTFSQAGPVQTFVTVQPLKAGHSMPGMAMPGMSQ